jgi:hypothetical protein
MRVSFNVSKNNEVPAAVVAHYMLVGLWALVSLAARTFSPAIETKPIGIEISGFAIRLRPQLAFAC